MMFILLSVLLLLPLLWWYYNYLWFERYLKKFPGPTPLPLVGSALDFLNRKEILNRMSAYVQKYRGDMKAYIAFEPILVLSEFASVEFILSSTTILKKSKQYVYLSKWLGNGLLLSNGLHWKKHRKIITPAFHFQVLEKYVSVFNSASDVFVDRLKYKLNTLSFDIYPLVTLCTLDIMCESALGTCVNAQINSESEYVNSVKKICEIVVDRTTSPLQQYDAYYNFTENCRNETKALKILHHYTNSVIQQRRQKRAENKNQNSFQEGTKSVFLDVLLDYINDGASFSESDVREEVDTFLFEGHDTTASAITFALYSLANHPDIQSKVYEEIISILSDDPRKQPTYKDLLEMKYLELVIKETLRLYPSVPFYGRTLTENVEYCGTVLPKGITILLYAIGVHRNPKHFPNPEVFDPDRFLPDNIRDRNPFCYIPFSAGPRNCIGQKFALLEMKSTISKVLRNYRLLPSLPEHKPYLVVETILRSSNGVCIRIEKR